METVMDRKDSVPYHDFLMWYIPKSSATYYAQ